MAADTSGPGVFGPHPYVSKSDVEGRIVAVLRGISNKRRLGIDEFRSRAVPAGQIHELMSTDEDPSPGGVVDHVALIAFFEILTGGVILVGDRLDISGAAHGTVAGFNGTHMPNHQNICLQVDQLVDGEALALRPGDLVRFSRDV